uniref:Uncharacterized protein n=1 Tax=Cuerna arida TaxID=1464854 RepID=A0A1B6F782_9HEMI
MIAIALGLLVACSSVSALPRPGPMPRAAPGPQLGTFFNGLGGCGCGVPCYGGFGVTEAFGYAEPPVLVGEEVLVPQAAYGAFPYGGLGGFGAYPGASLGFNAFPAFGPILI